MRYKEDWESAKKHFGAFWQGEMLDRCTIGIRAPKDKSVVIPQPKDDEAYRTDPEAIIRYNRAVMENTCYLGDAFPLITLDLGASGHAAFFKGERHYIDGTVWFFPSLSDPRELEFDPDSLLYRKTIEIAEALAEDSKGDYCISMPDDSGNADALAHLMGSENLLCTMIDDPEGVEEGLRKIQKAYEDVMRRAREITKGVNDGGGCIGWLNTWAPGFHAQMQCDLAAMISKEHFDRFIAPELTAQSNFLDYALYHLDGIEVRRHLDTLLSIPTLKAIQWTQVVGQPSCLEFLDDLKRIQKAGKRLVIIVSPDQIEPLLTELSSKGLYLLTSASDKEEAEAILKCAEKWSHE